MLRRIVRLGLLSVLFGLACTFVWGVMSVLNSLALRPVDARVPGHLAPDVNAIAPLSFTITLEPVVTTGLANPVYLTHAGDGSGRLFVVEQGGLIRVIKNGTLQTAPYLDIRSLVLSGGERGLLSVAFDPDFKTNGTFYVDYTDIPSGNTVVARYVVSDPASDVANPINATTILYIPQPEANHNGGQLQFGPKDGYLYVGMGDGGGAGDQHGTIGNGQDLGVLLGKLLRINVRGVPAYTIPSSNPFTRTTGARPEAWAYGLRNPWRFSFDRVNGDLYIGDVGQNCYEEIDYQPADSHGGENYGWRLMEGFHAFDPAQMSNCGQPIISPLTLTLPITDYGHNLGVAVVGGYVYRGVMYPQMNGVYFFGDDGSGRIWAMQQVSPGKWASSEKLDTPYSISAFGEDEGGELYVVDLGGQIFRIVSSAPPPDLSPTTKQASTGAVQSGDALTYTIVLRNAGGSFSNTVRLTDTIPLGLVYVTDSFTATLGILDASLAPTLTWHSSLSATKAITLTFAVTVSAVNTAAIQNIVAIDPGIGAPFERSATIIVNGFRIYLPLVVRNASG